MKSKDNKEKQDKKRARVVLPKGKKKQKEFLRKHATNLIKSEKKEGDISVIEVELPGGDKRVFKNKSELEALKDLATIRGYDVIS